MTMIIDLKGHGHILSSMIDFVGVHKVNLLLPIPPDIVTLLHLHYDLDI